MEKTDSQLSLDFSKSISSETGFISRSKNGTLSLVYSQKSECEHKKQRDRKEEILAEVSSYAATLKW